jgi:flavin-dependent dehydrogenase
MTATETIRHDVVVVGARCAGAATARLLAQQGHDVLLLDRASLPSDALSTHGLARGGVVQLARWGLLDRVLDSGAPAVREVTFSSPDGTATRRVKERAGVDLLVAPRRVVLDALLLEDAVAYGARARTGTTVTGLLRDADGRIIGVTARGRDHDLVVHAQHVVAADGVRSALAPMLGARVTSAFHADLALYYAYVAEADWGPYEFHVGPQSYAGVFPTHGGEGCVWLTRPRALLEDVRSAGARRTEAFVDALCRLAPSLGARARAGRVTSPVRGTAGLPNHVRRPAGAGWSLVGDAGYHRDPITGHGITDAFRDAELLAEALHRWLSGESDETTAMRRYAATRDAAIRDVLRLTREFCRFPDPSRFVELQVELAAALDREATEFASRPAPAGRLIGAIPASVA